jgi:glucan biosynthesis protein
LLDQCNDLRDLPLRAIVEATGNYRIFFKFDPAGTRLAELRLTLESNDKRWGETWLYRWTR